MFNQSDEDVEFAIHFISRACDLGRVIQEEMTGKGFTKSDRTPVTVADFAIQALAGYLLEQEEVKVPLVAEEQVGELRSPERSSTLEQVTSFLKRFVPDATSESVCDWIEKGTSEPQENFWTLDPVDGTKGFLRGDQYAVALAKIEDSTVQLGALGCPNLTGCRTEEPGGEGSILLGIRGEGAWTKPAFKKGEFRELTVSDKKDHREAVMLRSFESSHTNVAQLEAIVRELDMARDPIKMDSQAKYAVLAAGNGDLLYRLLSEAQPGYKEKIWDQAPGSIILEEAGGQITDLEGKDLDFSTGIRLENNRGVFASNGHLHDVGLEIYQKIEEEMSSL